MCERRAGFHTYVHNNTDLQHPCSKAVPFTFALMSFVLHIGQVLTSFHCNTVPTLAPLPNWLPDVAAESQKRGAWAPIRVLGEAPQNGKPVLKQPVNILAAVVAAFLAQLSGGSEPQVWPNFGHPNFGFTFSGHYGGFLLGRQVRDRQRGCWAHLPRESSRNTPPPARPNRTS